MTKKSHFKHYSLVFMVILAITLLSSRAEANDLYKEWHFSGDTFTVAGDVYTVTHYNFYDTNIILAMNKNSYIINEGECDSNPTRQFCITEIYRELENSSEKDHIKFEDGKAYAGILITISEKRPDITITKSYSTSSPYIKSIVDVSLTIENKGVAGTESFFYSEEYPAGVEILTAASSLTVSGRSLSYASNIPAETTKTFIYTFRINDYLSFSTTGSANYSYQGTSYTAKSSSNSIKVARPFEMTVDLSPTSMEPNERADFAVKIQNKLDKSINVSELIMNIPPQVIVSPKQGVYVKQQAGPYNNQYYWSGIVEGNKTQVIDLTLTPSKSGTFKISNSVKVRDSYGKELNETQNTTITATIKPLEPILSIIENTVAEGARYRVAFSVKNPNLNIAFKNIQASIKSEMFPEMPVSLDMLFANTTKTLLINDKLEAPLVDANKAFNIEASGTYIASTGEIFDFSKKGTLTVTPVSDIIDIVQSIDTEEANQGGNITVTVTIKNNNEESISVNTYDFYSQGLLLIGGKTSATVLFDTAGSKQVYTYKLNIPFEYNSTELSVITSASIPLKDFYANKTATVKVKLAEPVIEQNKTNATQQENTTAPPTKPADQPTAKPGFFRSVINTITEFFKRLLGL